LISVVFPCAVGTDDSDAVLRMMRVVKFRTI
jgi:hypothetical protein